jgi:hypothetical protein
MMRALLASLLALTTGACAVVGSERPLFAAADGRGQSALRAGLWAMPDEDCTFDTAAKSREWNDCANATFVSSATFSERPNDHGEDRETLRYVLAGGDPRVLQIQAPEGEKNPNYAYAGLRPLRADEAGRIVEARVWLAMCEPPVDPTAAREDKPERSPLPAGLVRDREGPGCTAASAAAARGAVSRSEAWASDRDFTLIARWVRDAD